MTNIRDRRAAQAASNAAERERLEARWQELKDYLDALAAGLARDADELLATGYNDDAGNRIRARGDTVARIRQHMDEMEAAP